MTRVLITAAGGFIGSRVTRYLADAGFEVGALVGSDSRRSRVAGLDRVDILNASLHGGGEWVSAVRRFKPDACIHLAWYAEPGKYLTSPANLDCLTHSVALIRELLDVGCRHVTIAGSCSEYDTSAGWLREDGATRPATLYAATKLSLSIIAAQLARDAGITMAWARLFYMYGPHEDPRRLVPAAIRALLNGQAFPSSDGEQVRDFLHVDDVASGLVALTSRAVDGVVNVCSGEPVTVKMLLETIASEIGGRELLRFGVLPYRSWDPMFICGDNTRLRGAGWQPKFSLREGIADVSEWWRKQRQECDEAINRH